MYTGPVDPLFGDPWNPSRALADHSSWVTADPARTTSEEAHLSTEEREDVEADLADLDVYQLVLAPVGILGLSIECDGCRATHYLSWGLVRENLETVLADPGSSGYPVHEPACNPSVLKYVTWEYARGFVDGLLAGSSWNDPVVDELPGA